MGKQRIITNATFTPKGGEPIPVMVDAFPKIGGQPQAVSGGHAMTYLPGKGLVSSWGPQVVTNPAMPPGHILMIDPAAYSLSKQLASPPLVYETEPWPSPMKVALHELVKAGQIADLTAGTLLAFSLITTGDGPPLRLPGLWTPRARRARRVFVDGLPALPALDSLAIVGDVVVGRTRRWLTLANVGSRAALVQVGRWRAWLAPGREWELPVSLG